MGYRSQVAMMIEGASVPALIASHRMNNRFSAETHKTCMEELTVRKDGIYLHAESWKWYDSYEDIQWFEALWDEAAEMEADGSKLAGRFMRVGENDDDVEDRAFGDPDWDKVQLVRYLEVNFPPPDAEAQFEEKAA